MVHAYNLSYLGGGGRKLGGQSRQCYQDPILKTKFKNQKGWGIAQVIECFSSKPEVLGSILSTAKKKQISADCLG
jgi:hypothetical protein